MNIYTYGINDNMHTVIVDTEPLVCRGGWTHSCELQRATKMNQFSEEGSAPISVKGNKVSLICIRKPMWRVW